VSISADCPAIMRLVSNDLPLVGSSGPVPLVAVWGALSSFKTLTASPLFTVSVYGAYGGLPGVAAPEGMDSVPAGGAAAVPAPPPPPVAACVCSGEGLGTATGGGTLNIKVHWVIMT
jgi:hypothetical protein